LNTQIRNRLALLTAALIGGACTPNKPLPPGEALTDSQRLDAIRHAIVWSPTEIEKIDFKQGPRGEDSFEPNELVICEYKEKKMNGASPKFTCELKPGEEIKVKYGSRNAEVFGEVLSTRLFWGLGFYADRMYPVRVHCRGCSNDPKKNPKKTAGEAWFELAAVERKLPGRAMEIVEDSGWKWSELKELAPDAPADEATHRDGLRLLAAFIQHSDSKAPNQRLLCPKGYEVGKLGCRQPVLMVQDLGLSFGEASLLNKNKNAASYKDWVETPVWNDKAKCVAELKGSFTGRFSYPKITEAGRAFLAGLLMRLSDAQLQDLFQAARIRARSGDPSGDPAKDAPPVSVDTWVQAFKEKRAEIANHRCPS
jgi:hypothetical protein